MNAAEITALCTGVVSAISAITALVVAIRHRSDPNAHAIRNSGSNG